MSTDHPGYDPYCSGTGFDPLLGLGVFSHGMRRPRRLAGLSLRRVTNQPRRPATAVQRHTAWPSGSGSGRSVSEFGTPPLSMYSALPAHPISCTGAFVRECTTRPYPVCHRLWVLCIRLTVRVPPLSATCAICPPHLHAVPTTVPYAVMDSHMLSAVILYRLILSVLLGQLSLEVEAAPDADHSTNSSTRSYALAHLGRVCGSGKDSELYLG